MRTTSNKKTKFDHHSREVIKEVNGHESALCIELMFVLPNYTNSTQEKALVHMLEIVRGQQNDRNRYRKGMVSGEDQEGKHPES